jgi:hypothetical protein
MKAKILKALRALALSMHLTAGGPAIACGAKMMGS